MLARLPITHMLRVRERDNKLWKWEKLRAKLCGFNNIFCPCRDCEGVVPCTFANASMHLKIEGGSSVLSGVEGARQRRFFR